MILPLFLSFLIVLISFINLSIMEMALQSSLSDSTKMIASHFYPVEQLYAEGKQRVMDTRAAGAIADMLGKVRNARDKVQQSEQFVDDYSAYVPDPVVQLMEWERTKREKYEQMPAEQYRHYADTVFVPLLNQAFGKLVYTMADPKLIREDWLKVTKVTFPDFEDHRQAFVGIEAEYHIRLAVPFFHPVVTIKKQAYERAWVGA